MKYSDISPKALLAATALLIGVGSAQAQDKTLTLLTWNLPVYEEKFNGWIAEFNEKHPDITVEWIDKKGSEWATFYQTQLAAGTPPDIVNIQGALWAEYAADGQLLDMTPYLQKDPAFKDSFSAGALDLWTLDGKTYMVPWYFNKTLLYINKEMRDAAGLTGGPSSFEELLSYARAMSKEEGKNGFLTTNFDWLYWPLFRMNGVDILNDDMSAAAFNTPEGLKTVDALASATKDGVINNISWTGRWVEPNTAFASRNIGMYLAPNSALFWAASKADWINDENVEVMEAPGNWAAPNHHGFGISSSTKHPEAALDLIKIATSDKWQSVMSNTFSILTLKPNVDAELIAKFKTEAPLKAKILELAGQNLGNITGYLKSPKDARVKDAVWTEIQPALLGEADPAESLAAAESRVNRVLSRR